MNDEPIQVWGSGTARTLRVYWALHEFDLPYIAHPVRTRTADMDAPAFLRVSPGRKIPAIEHDSLLLTESGAITDYLFALAEARSHANNDDLAIAARIEQWSCFSLMELDAAALYVLRRHRGLAEIYGEAPAAVTAARDYFSRQAGVIAAELNDGREFLAGERLSKADIFLVTCCDWALIEGLELPTPLFDYRARLIQRESYRAACAVNFKTT